MAIQLLAAWSLRIWPVNGLFTSQTRAHRVDQFAREFAACLHDALPGADLRSGSNFSLRNYLQRQCPSSSQSESKSQRLEAEAERIAKQEMSEAIAKVKEIMSTFGLTIEHLQSAVAAKTRKVAKKVKARLECIKIPQTVCIRHRPASSFPVLALPVNPTCSGSLRRYENSVVS